MEKKKRKEKLWHNGCASIFLFPEVFRFEQNNFFNYNFIKEHQQNGEDFLDIQMSNEFAEHNLLGKKKKRKNSDIMNVQVFFFFFPRSFFNFNEIISLIRTLVDNTNKTEKIIWQYKCQISSLDYFFLYLFPNCARLNNLLINIHQKLQLFIVPNLIHDSNLSSDRNHANLEEN